MIKIKKCNVCKVLKLENEFYYSNKKKNQLQFWCKECKNKYQKKLDQSEKENNKKRASHFKVYKTNKKICILCNEEKDPSEFWWKNREIGSLRPRCRRCELKYKR